MSYYDNSTAYISNNYNRESRLRAIAMNAVREAVIAFGRIDLPYSDNDSATTENIFNQLRAIGEEGNVIRQQEHQPLTVTATAPSAAAAQIAKVLDTVDNDLRETTPEIAKVKVPVAKA